MTTHPTRLLRPDALLQRLRPVTVATTARELRDATRLYHALALLRTHFPAELETEFSRAALQPLEWHRALGAVCALVEQHGWLPINWAALNEAWALWMQSAGDDDERGDHLAAYIYYIPVEMYGFSDHEKIFEFPPMELLRALLDKNVEVVSSDLLVAAELYDALEHDWGERQRQAAWQRLEQIERDPGRYASDAARFLPELARWACGNTGNPLLDHHFDPYNAGPWYTWAEELPRVRRWWQRARPVVDMFHRLMAWCEQDQANLTKLTHFFINGDNINDFDW
jgi:hypothetical protein